MAYLDHYQHGGTQKLQKTFSDKISPGQDVHYTNFIKIFMSADKIKKEKIALK